MGRRRGRRGGQGNRGRKSGRARGSVGGGKSKSKNSSSRGASSGRRGGQGNRGRTSTKNNAASNKGNRGGYGKGGASTGRRGGQGNKNTPTGRAKGTVTRTNLSKNLSKLGIGKLGKAFANRVLGPGVGLVGNALNNPRVGQAIAQAVSNSPHVSDYNKDYRDKSTLTPQQLRRVERWEQKTGRDWEKRKEIGKINMSMADVAKFAKLDQNDWKSKLYNALPKSIRDARINKTFYGTEKKKGWHSSQRPGRGHGVKKNILKIDQGSQPNVTISKSTSDGRTGNMGPFQETKGGGPVGAGIALANALQIKKLQQDKVKAEEKALDTQYKNDQAIYNNNKKNMSVTISPGSQNTSNTGPNTSDDEWLSKAYKEALGRDFSKSKGGGQYWLDQMKANPTTHTRDEVLRMLKGSDEGKKYAASGKVQIGGIDPTKSISSQAGPGTWASHFAPGGVFENQNAAAAATQIAKDVGHTPSEAYFNTGVTDQTGADKTGTTIPPEVAAQTDGWWNQFADADAFKKFLQGDAKEETKTDGGMGDFMKFMMLMNVMRPGGGGGGYGGSQFGYGGLNPGGVQAAYDPMKSLQSMGTWFKDNFGSGSGTTSDNLNVGKV